MIENSCIIEIKKQLIKKKTKNKCKKISLIKTDKEILGTNNKEIIEKQMEGETYNEIIEKYIQSENKSNDK